MISMFEFRRQEKIRVSIFSIINVSLSYYYFEDCINIPVFESMVVSLFYVLLSKKELKFANEHGQVPNEHRHVPKVLLVKLLI